MYFGLSFVTIAGIAAVLLSRVYLGVASLAAVSVGAILAIGIAACWSVVRPLLPRRWTRFAAHTSFHCSLPADWRRHVHAARVVPNRVDALAAAAVCRVGVVVVPDTHTIHVQFCGALCQ